MKKVLIIVAALLLVGALALCGGYLYYRSEVDGSGAPGESQEFVVEQGETPNAIAERLKEEGIIDSSLCFKLYLRQTGAGPSLQYGRFTLAPGMSYDEIIAELQTPSAREDVVTLTFPEGTTALGIAQILEDAGLCDADAFLACANGEEYTETDGSTKTADFSQHSFWAEVPQDTPRFMRCEGYLFPETYQFFENDTIYNYVDTFYQEFEKRVDQTLRDELAAEGMTLDDAVILASFVQEEAGNAEDANVAQVFLNRLAEGSPYPRLESNASSYVQNPEDNNYLYNWVAPYYGGWDKIPEDLYHAYNTYECVGLPAGPISNPGIDAIRAVAEPNTGLVSENGNSPCYFFVTDLTGKYYYGATIEEHQANVETARQVNAGL